MQVSPAIRGEAQASASGRIDRTSAATGGGLQHRSVARDSVLVPCRLPSMRPLSAEPSARQQAALDFARELLACDLIMEVAPASCVPRLVAECRALLEAEQTGDWTQTPGKPLAWLRLEMIATRTYELRFFLKYRHALQLPEPSLSSLVGLFGESRRAVFEALFNALSAGQQRELLAMDSMQEKALWGSESLGRWYRQACEARGLPLDRDLLWERCRAPEVVDLIATPCFALLDVTDQLATTQAWLDRVKRRVVLNRWTALPLSRYGQADHDDEARAVGLWQRLAQNEPERLRAWLQTQGPFSLALVLFVYARYDSQDSLAVLGRLLGEALQQGLAPQRGVLSLPDDRGLFLAHHVFRESGQVALELLLPWCQLDRLSVAGGKFCSKGCHPLHGQRLYALNLSCDGRNAFSLEHGHGVPDSRQSTRLMLDLVGEEGLLELALGATNRGTPGWWVWLLQALQLCPALAMRLRQDPRVRDISVQPLPGAGVPLMAMLGRLWQPFEPLSCADQQQAFLQEIVCETRDRFQIPVSPSSLALQQMGLMPEAGSLARPDHDSEIRWMWELLNGSLILCEAPACRWLLHQLLDGKEACWPLLRHRFFDGHSRRFYQVKDLLVASWCQPGQGTTARRFDDWMAEQIAGVQYQPASREPAACLAADSFPALFSKAAVDTYGRTVWFRTDQGIVRLKLHKKGEPLADLLREQWALEFFDQESDRLPLKGLRPQPLGCGWLPDFAGWLAERGLDAATQKALADAVELAEDGAVWGVVLSTPDEGYHHYVHQPDATGSPDAALAGICLAARDAGLLLREGLAPTNLLPLYHDLPGVGGLKDGRAWQFLFGSDTGRQDLGMIRDWDGSATDHGNVARAPYGLRDWADVRSLDSLRLDSKTTCPEQRWQSGAVRVNEAGKILTGLVLLSARLLSADFDCTCPHKVQANRDRMRGVLQDIFVAFLEGMGQNPQSIARWQERVQEHGLLGAAVRQIVFWCETGDAPSFEPHLRAATLPADIPRSYDPIPVLNKPLRASLWQKNTLTDHQYKYPLKQVTALIYMTLGHVIADAQGGAIDVD